MDVLREWLQPTILRELREGLTWLEGSWSDSHSRSSHFVDDGSTLRAKVSKPEVVQINKLVTYEEPIEAWVSDSITRLPVVFAAPAVRRFRHETRKRLTQDRLGGLIQIKDFEIIATHSGPRNSRLTILIKDFQSLGSVGSGGYGLPRPLEVLPQVIELLDQLKMLREKQEFIKAEVAGKDNGSPVGSQSGIMCSSDNSPSASQEKFATQVPCSRVTDFSHLKPVKSNGISGHGSLDDQLAQTLASRSVVNKLKGSSHSAPRILNKCSSTPKNKKLASQLHPSDVPPKGISKKVNNQSHQPINATELLALLPANQASKLSRRAKLDASPGLLVGLRDGENGTSKATPTTRREMDEQSFKAETRSQSNEKSLETQSITTLTTAGVETSGKSIGEIDVSISATSKREFSSRISRREVTVSKAQQVLLDSSDSWIPAEPGLRQPVANIPIAIFQNISDHVEGSSHYLPPKNQSPSLDHGRTESALTSESGSCHDSESEILISPRQWPPSPQPQIYEQLPPDSSMESSARANELEKELVEEFPGQKLRKLSQSPASSASSLPMMGGLTPRSRNLRKISSISPSSHATPTQDHLGTSRSPKQETHAVTAELGALGMHHHDRSGMHSATSCAYTPKTIASVSTAALHICVTCHERFDSAENLSHHKTSCQKSSHQFEQNGTNDDLSGAAQKGGNLPTLSSEIACGVLKEEKDHIPGARHTSTLPSRITHHTEPEDYHPQQQIVGKASPRKERSTSMFDLYNIGVISDHPEDIRDLNASKPETVLQASNQRLPNYPEKDLYGNIIAQQLSSTASRPEEPVLQVKATPYVNGRLINTGRADVSPLLSPSREKNGSSNDVARAAEPKGKSLSSTVFEVSSAEVNSSKLKEGILSEFQSSKMSQEVPIFADSPPGDLHVREPAKFQSSGSAFGSAASAESITHVEDTFVSATTPIKTATGDYLAENSQTSPTPRLKRKLPGLQQPYSEIAKRRKHLMSPTLTFTEIPQSRVVPSILGSKYQQDFHESRKVSMAYIVKDGTRSPPVHAPVSKLSTYARSMSNESIALGEGTVPSTTIVSETSPNVFDQFKAKYPDYAANLKQFVAICRKIARLVKDDRMEHQYLWDDFIIRHRTEYPTYLSSCADNAEDPFPYEQFYHEKIAKPLFIHGVVRPDNLFEAFSPGQEAGDQQYPTLVNDLVVKKSSGKVVKDSPSPRKDPCRTQELSSPKIMVDLTPDNVRSPRKQSQVLDFTPKKSPRSIPWATPYRSQVRNTPTSKLISHKALSSHVPNGCFRSAPPSSLKPVKMSSRVSSSRVQGLFDHGKSVSFTRAGISIGSAKTGETCEASEKDASTVPSFDQSNSVGQTNSIYVKEVPNKDQLSQKNTKANQDLRRQQLMPEQREHTRGIPSSTPQPDQASPAFLPTSFLPTSRMNSRSENQYHQLQQTLGTDGNTLLANFFRAYTSIRGGNGNSYARDMDLDQSKIGMKHSAEGD